jgi:hypothetical protein
MLIFEDLAPITFSVGLIQAPLQVVHRKMLAWRSAHASLNTEVLAFPLEEALLSLTPLTTIPRRWLLLSTQNQWTAYFDNGLNGPDPSPAVGYLCERLRCSGLVVTSVPHTLDEKGNEERGISGGIKFEMFAPKPTTFLNFERAISVIYESGRWQFDDAGTVQSFEYTGRYKRRRAQDRFTEEMLKKYCAALGFEVDNPSFYQPLGMLTSAENPMPAGFLTVSLLEAQRRIGLSR